MLAQQLEVLSLVPKTPIQAYLQGDTSILKAVVVRQ